MSARFWGNAILPANVENLILASSGSVGGIGNALDNIIVAGSVGATIDGRAGNDVLVGGTGADIFLSTKGNGSDVIVNFQANRDVAFVQTYGVTSFAQLLTLGQQVGADTKFTFSNGETLTLRDVTLSSLHAWDFGFMPVRAALPAGYVQQSGATAGDVAFGWHIINNAWNAGTLRYGTDYTIDTTYSKADMTQGATFTWSFPYTTTLYAPIRAYPNVLFGVAPMGDRVNATDTKHVFPVQLSSLAGLTADHDVGYVGNGAGFNVAYDIWFTSVPNGGTSSVTNEVMLWVHKGELTPSGSVVGTMQINGINATIYHTGTYTAIVTDQDLPKGTIDLGAIFDKLEGLGILSGNEYLAAIELGAEIVSGIGSLTINNLDLTVRTAGANGTITKSIVTGAGTTQTTESTSLAAANALALRDMSVPLTSVTNTIDSATKLVNWYDSTGRLLGSDSTHVDTLSRTTTKHFDASGALIGGETRITGADGSVTTQHFDATRTITGAEKTISQTNGAKAIQYYDAAFNLIGTDTVKINANGKTVTSHYDANGKLLSGDTWVADAKGVETAMHYDTSFAFTGGEVTTKGSDGSVTVQRYDAGWTLTGTDITRIDAKGLTITTAYDAHWSVTGTNFKGTAAVDTILGTSGANDFHGGIGGDFLYGGAGEDHFYFDTAIGRDVDTIYDFGTGADSLWLDQDVFKALKGSGTLDASEFVLGTVANDANDHILYDKASGNLWYDADGSGAGAAVLFAHLSPNATLAASDFHLF